MAKIKDNIMSKIKDKQVKLRSKYVYITEKLGRFGGLFIILGLALVFLVFLFVYFSHTDNLYYLHFGFRGVPVFFQTLPYFFLVSFIALVILGGFLLSRIYYKKPLILLAIILAAAALLFGAASVVAGIPDRVADFAISGKKEIFMRPFMHRGLRGKAPGVAGQVSEKTDFGFYLSNFCHEIKVNCSCDEVKAGDFVVSIGRWEGDEFIADGVKVVPPEHLKLIIDRENGPMPHHNGPPPQCF